LIKIKANNTHSLKDAQKIVKLELRKLLINRLSSHKNSQL